MSCCPCHDDPKTHQHVQSITARYIVLTDIVPQWTSFVPPEVADRFNQEIRDDLVKQGVDPDKYEYYMQTGNINFCQQGELDKLNQWRDRHFKCAHCGNTRGILLDCSGCQQVVYCQSECQRQDWHNHKNRCAAWSLEIGGKRHQPIGRICPPESMKKK